MVAASMEAAIFNCRCDQMQNCEGGCETIYYYRCVAVCRQNYFGDSWNVLDFIIVVGSIVDIVAGRTLVSLTLARQDSLGLRQKHACGAPNMPLLTNTISLLAPFSSFLLSPDWSRIAMTSDLQFSTIFRINIEF